MHSKEFEVFKSHFMCMMSTSKLFKKENDLDILIDSEVCLVMLVKMTLAIMVEESTL
jgi:hypothetical protein